MKMFKKMLVYIIKIGRHTFERKLLGNIMYILKVTKSDDVLNFSMEIISDYLPFASFKDVIVKGLKEHKNSNVTNNNIDKIINDMNKNEIKVKGRMATYALKGTQFFFFFNNNEVEGTLSILYPKDYEMKSLVNIPIKKSLKNALIKIYSKDGILEKNKDGKSFKSLFQS